MHIQHSYDKRQPRALYYLFMVELWERFGFYTMRGLLVLYLTQVFLFSDSKSYALYGAFSALLWLTPSLGGYLSDHLLGYRRCLIIGGATLTTGYACLAFANQHIFYLGLSILLVGNGLFKPNVASLMGSLYDDPKDPRRDSGFTIYYMGINIGSLLAPIVAGLLTATYGWHVGFASAAVGMFIGLLIFVFGQGILGSRGLPPFPARLKQRFLPGISYAKAVYVGMLVFILAGYYLLYHVVISDYVLETISVILISAYLILSYRQNRGNRNKMIGALILVAFSIAFWTLYQQAPMTITLFTQRNVDRHLFGFTIPTVMFQSLNPVFIILFTPILAWFWNHLGRTRYRISTASKFTLAIFIMGVGFLVLKWAADYFSDNGIVSAWWIVLSYGLQSFAELAISPIGLSMMTAMAPDNMTGMMVGMWFLASAISNALGGEVAQIASIPKGDHLSLLQASDIYGHAFSLYGWSAIAIAGIALLFIPLLRKMMDDK